MSIRHPIPPEYDLRKIVRLESTLCGRMSTTRLLAIAITTAAIIAAATTTSLSAATPAFATKNCDVTLTVCSGGSGCGRNGCTAGTKS
jgi:uncharacterized membrane protein